MTALLVGGDRLGTIPDELARKGFTEVIHWPGRYRGKSGVTKPLPRHVDQVIVFCDYVAHDLARRVKQEAKDRGIPITFCRRSSSWIHCRLGAVCQDAT